MSFHGIQANGECGIDTSPESAGVPQIILAQWIDLYDMAGRAEYRGIGIFGNRNVAPDIEAIEFSAAVERLVKPGEESEGFRTRAWRIEGLCRGAGGKRAAVDKLLEIIGVTVQDPMYT